MSDKDWVEEYPTNVRLIQKYLEKLDVMCDKHLKIPHDLSCSITEHLLIYDQVCKETQELVKLFRDDLINLALFNNFYENQ